MRHLLLAATALTAVAGSAMAVDVKLYGTVNKAVMGYDDGRSAETNVVDNNLESTRFGLAAEKALDNGMAASALFEVEQNSNASNAITQNSNGTGNNGTSRTPNGSTVTLTERMARVGLSGEWGGIYVGQQDVATDDAFAHDLTAATSVMNPNVGAWGGGLVFQRKNGATWSNAQAGGTNLTPGLFALGNDGALGSADAIRYNSPIFNGFNGSLSTSQGGNVDATVRYNGEVAGIKLDGALGHTMVNSATTNYGVHQETATMGSISALHNSGLGATLAYYSQGLKNKTAGIEDPSLMYAKVGYAWDAYGVAVDYAAAKDPVAVSTDHEMDSYGVAADWTLADGVVVGATVRNYSADVTGVTGIEDIMVGVANMRVKF